MTLVRDEWRIASGCVDCEIIYHESDDVIGVDYFSVTHDPVYFCRDDERRCVPCAILAGDHWEGN